MLCYTRQHRHSSTGTSEKWLFKQDAHTFHADAAKHFPRSRVPVYGIDQQFQVDLVDMTVYSKENDGI